MHARFDAKRDPGRFADQPSRDCAADWVGEAVFHGVIALWSWSLTDVRRILAPGLEPSPRSDWPASGVGEHPVLFVHGAQTRGANFFAGLALRSGLAYHEAGILVPFVRRRDRPELLTAVPRMYADFFPPVWHDEAYYGLGKKLVHFRDEGPIRLWTSSDGRPLVEIAFDARGAWHPADRTDSPALAIIERAASLPIVGCLRDGSLIGSHFSWDFRPASVREADSLVDLHAGVFDALPGRSCADVGRGTIEVRDMRWRLGWPGRFDV